MLHLTDCNIQNHIADRKLVRRSTPAQSPFKGKIETVHEELNAGGLNGLTCFWLKDHPDGALTKVAMCWRQTKVAIRAQFGGPVGIRRFSIGSRRGICALQTRWFHTTAVCAAQSGLLFLTGRKGHSVGSFGFIPEGAGAILIMMSWWFSFFEFAPRWPANVLEILRMNGYGAPALGFAPTTLPIQRSHLRWPV